MKTKSTQGIKNKLAFTLIEIMVTIVIVGVLASLGLMRYQKVIMQARERDAINQLKSIHMASEIYRSRAGQYWQRAGGSLDDINQVLGLNILSNGFYYFYSGYAPTTYNVVVTLFDSNGNQIFRVKVDQSPLSTTPGSANPCCDVAGECPTLPDC